MDVDQEAENVDDPIKMEVDTDTSEKSSEQPKSDVSPAGKDVIKSEELLVSIKVESSSDVKTEEGIGTNGSYGKDLKDIIRDAGSSNDDDDEKVIHLTADEVKENLIKKVLEYMMDPSINPMLALNLRVKELTEKRKEQVDDYNKLSKGLQMLQRKHEIFLRSIGILPKVAMVHACVSANLPMETVPNHESLLKKELSITKVTTPSKTTNNASSVQCNTKPAASAAKSVECIDLTDDDASSSRNSVRGVSNPPFSMVRHPAPLPPRPPATGINNVRVPPKPRLKISAEDKGIVLQWDMPPLAAYNPIINFEIFGYQEQRNTIINTLLWKKIGTVRSMTLPMACTLTQFVDGNRYHFAIRAVDSNGTCGHYSDAISIVYKQKVPQKK